MSKDSKFLLVQDFIYTPYDWRVAMLRGKPLLVTSYDMVRDPWQIIK